MTSNDAENLSSSRQIRFAIPVEIRNHPKLDQATKFAWVYIWELANFRPDTIITSVARLAADLGKSERAARRWIQCLAESGLIEMIPSSRRGECVFYVNPPAEWEGASPPPSVHKVFGISVPDMPDENEDCGKSGTDLPIHSPSEEKNKILSEKEKREDMALKLIIEQRRAQMPRDSLGISVDGTEPANCEQSRVINNSLTVNRIPYESDGNAEPRPAETPPPARGPLSSTMNSIVAGFDSKTRGDSPTSTELSFQATYEYLRTEFPDDDDVWPQFLRKLSSAVAFGDLSKQDLFDVVKQSKMPNINKPGSYFCSTIKHYLPVKKPK